MTPGPCPAFRTTTPSTRARSRPISHLRRYARAAFAAALIATAPQAIAPAAAQNPPAQDTAQAGGQALRVFFDCSGPSCDDDFYRREVQFVNYTRDRTLAQVHLLITSEGTGAGGRRFTLDFIGREEFVGVDDRLEVVTRANLASEQQMTQVAASMRLGLLRYIARTQQAQDIRILYEGPVDAGAVAQPEDDPWDFWVFRLRANGFLSVDEQTEAYRLSGGLTANRITDALKLEFGFGINYNESAFDTSDSTTVISVRKGWDFEGLNVWSLTDHWSYGVSYGVLKSTFSNYDLQIQGGPAIEYNIFPYSESTRRQLTFSYEVGVEYADYIEQTVFTKTKETHPRHALSGGLSVRQPWGGSFGFVEFSQYLHDLALNRFRIFVGADFRLFRGLSLNFNANYQRIRDQLNVPLGDATEEEILLRQRVLQSGYEYSFSVGFAYTFGSIFSNVVNPRMERF
ncbi:MAG: hypothetical protein R3195_05575 [Gemmatimonadota bacterium]|nr:hypothetical protein [Gemmatimonadota bacterium]